jgi:hypothetical protein
MNIIDRAFANTDAGSGIGAALARETTNQESPVRDDPMQADTEAKMGTHGDEVLRRGHCCFPTGHDLSGFARSQSGEGVVQARMVDTEPRSRLMN